MDTIFYRELQHSVFLSHLGDLTMNCFSPHKDVVVPSMAADPEIYRSG